jgi:hypothetical protein
MSDRISDGMLRQIIGDEKLEAPSCNISKDRRKSWGLEGYPLAMVYSPIQCFRDVYDIDTALMQGTVFSELDLPFMGASVGKGGNCRG